MMITDVDRLKVRDLKRFVTQFGRTVKGCCADYVTVYRDFCRADGDYSASQATKLYTLYGGEYCTLLEVLAALYRSHQQQKRSAS